MKKVSLLAVKSCRKTLPLLAVKTLPRTPDLPSVNLPAVKTLPRTPDADLPSVLAAASCREDASRHLAATSCRRHLLATSYCRKNPAVKTLSHREVVHLLATSCREETIAPRTPATSCCEETTVKTFCELRTRRRHQQPTALKTSAGDLLL